jgi:hypothetical protein
METHNLASQNETSLNPENTIFIFLYPSSMKPLKVIVSLFDPLLTLFRLSPFKNNLILHKGFFLDYESSFRDNGIEQEDKIILLSQDNLKHKTFRIKISEEESFWKQFLSLQLKTALLQVEQARLIDLNLIRIETTKSSYYHLAQQLSHFSEEEQIFPTNINYEKKEPSNLPLPNIFV